MAQVLIRNVSEGLIDAYKAKARLQGTSLEQVLRDLLERNAPFIRKSGQRSPGSMLQNSRRRFQR